MRSGYIGLVGRPNVGKSTLLNRILGQKIAIASPRPQTTRNRILGVKNLPGAQMVLLDTPGLHRPAGKGRSRLNQFMVGEALSVLEEVDGLVVLVESPDGGELKRSPHFRLDPAMKWVLGELVKVNKPAVLAINKIDRVRDKKKLLPLIEGWTKVHNWQAVVPISAQSGDNVDTLVTQAVALLPEGAAIYPEEMITDRAERFIGAEMIREQVFLLTKQEVPYATAVSIDEWLERGKDVAISATVHVEKEAQKKIVVGEGGRMVRDIGTRARMEIARLLDCPVHLKLFVRVDPGWTSDRAALRDLGYERE
jgi:GTP-binding protein Era